MYRTGVAALVQQVAGLGELPLACEEELAGTQRTAHGNAGCWRQSTLTRNLSVNAGPTEI